MVGTIQIPLYARIERTKHRGCRSGRHDLIELNAPAQASPFGRIPVDSLKKARRHAALEFDPIDEDRLIAGPLPKARRRIFGLHGTPSNFHGERHLRFSSFSLS